MLEIVVKPASDLSLEENRGIDETSLLAFRNAGHGLAEDDGTEPLFGVRSGTS